MTAHEFDEIMKDCKMYTLPDRKWCIELASKVPYASIAELIDNAEQIAEYCKKYI